MKKFKYTKVLKNMDNAERFMEYIKDFDVSDVDKFTFKNGDIYVFFVCDEETHKNIIESFM